MDRRQSSAVDNLGDAKMRRMHLLTVTVALLLNPTGAGSGATQNSFPAALGAKIDAAVAEVLASTGAPSASIALVKDGKVAYVHAYGMARLESKLPATTEMRYSIGSVSKQFTAAALLLLAEEGKLTLDDPVGRWLPGLTRAREVTIRQLLSMTSGYQDYWPQDYVMPPMLQSVTAQEILDQWAKQPLDFDPGTAWQYSNTNYVIAGVIIEKASGTPVLDFLSRRIFKPLGMNTVVDTDQSALPADQPERYRRFALGPARPAPKEGKGWMFAAGQLAMTPSDLGKWDISMMEQSVLKPASYRQLETELRLANGTGTGYGLGVSISLSNGRRLISHTGEVSGFTARNDVYPDDRAAAVVCVNLDASAAVNQIARRLSRFLFDDSESSELLDRARVAFEGLQSGRIDRSLFTPNANAYFNEEALKDFAESLGPLGAPQEFVEQSRSLRGGMTSLNLRIRWAKQTITASVFVMPDGRLEQFQMWPAE
jgi:D-alanyl-D-alanine carboxypeptidase